MKTISAKSPNAIEFLDASISGEVFDALIAYYGHKFFVKAFCRFEFENTYFSATIIKITDGRGNNITRKIIERLELKNEILNKIEEIKREELLRFIDTARGVRDDGF